MNDRARHPRESLTRSPSCRYTATWPRSRRPFWARRRTTGPATRTGTSRLRADAHHGGRHMDPRSDSKSSWLSALLAPVSVDEFLSRYWLKQYLFCRGSADRFSGLLSWTALNQILEHHWRGPFRFPPACLD